MDSERKKFLNNTFRLATAFSVAVTSASEISAQNVDNKSKLPTSNKEIAIPQVFELSNYDKDGDGFIEQPLSEIKSGDVIFRSSDGITRVESGNYIVPNNAFYIDKDGDGYQDQQVNFARVVVVMQDNLTYLFEPGGQKIIGVFPNGIGSAGSNSVASIRRINVRLGRGWGEQYSNQAGYAQNMFGEITLGTRYVVTDDPARDVDTFQEIHGTPSNLEFLLGEDISGGCVRHSDQTIRIISSHVDIGDFVLTVETPEDDEIDNSINLYDRTLLAAGMPAKKGSNVESAVLYGRDFTETMNNLSNLDEPTWVRIRGEELNSYPIAEHPFTRGNYSVIPCGTESYFIAEFSNNRERVIYENNRYRLNVSDTITLPSREKLPIDNFYKNTSVSVPELEEIRQNLSGGDIRVAAFQYLVWDYAYQYAGYVAMRESGQIYLNQEDLDLAIYNLSSSQIREIQLVTGIIPVNYSMLTESVFGSPGDKFAASRNRTLEHSLMNIFNGEPGKVYELDYRYPDDNSAFVLEDMDIHQPSFDHELRRTNQIGEDISDLINQGMRQNKSMVFRISSYRLATENLSYETGLAANHYYALLPQYSDIANGYIGIQDSMHPFEILIVPVDDITSLFSTITISN